MSIKINNKALQKAQINGKEVQKIVINGNTVWSATPPTPTEYIGYKWTGPSSNTISITGLTSGVYANSDACIVGGSYGNMKPDWLPSITCSTSDVTKTTISSYGIMKITDFIGKSQLDFSGSQTSSLCSYSIFFNKIKKYKLITQSSSSNNSTYTLTYTKDKIYIVLSMRYGGRSTYSGTQPLYDCFTYTASNISGKLASDHRSTLSANYISGNQGSYQMLVFKPTADGQVQFTWKDNNNSSYNHNAIIEVE